MVFRPGHPIDHHWKLVQDEDDRLGGFCYEAEQLLTMFLPVVSQLFFELNLQFKDLDLLDVLLDESPDLVGQPS